MTQNKLPYNMIRQEHQGALIQELFGREVIPVVKETLKDKEGFCSNKTSGMILTKTRKTICADYVMDSRVLTERQQALFMFLGFTAEPRSNIAATHVLALEHFIRTVKKPDGTSSTRSSLQNAVKVLSKKEFLRKVRNNYYMVNPKYLYEGTSKGKLEELVQLYNNLKAENEHLREAAKHRLVNVYLTQY